MMAFPRIRASEGGFKSSSCFIIDLSHIKSVDASLFESILFCTCVTEQVCKQFKAAEIYVSIYGESHRDTICALVNIFVAYIVLSATSKAIPRICKTNSNIHCVHITYIEQCILKACSLLEIFITFLFD